MLAKAVTFSDNFLYSITAWHLVAFGTAIFFAVIFLIFASLISNKTKSSLMLQWLSLATITIGPIFGYFAVEKLYKPVTISNLTIKHLYYQDIAELNGVITNLSKIDLIECKIKAKAYQKPAGSIDYALKLIKPQSKGSTTISIATNSSKAFQIDLPDIKYTDQNITTSISVRCR